jgi:predicted flap endonuclease-1-like 5' DNA nuclease
MSNKSSTNKCGTRWWEWMLAIIGVPMLALLIWLWLRRRTKEEAPQITRMRIDITPPLHPAKTPGPTAEEPPLTPDDLKHIDGIGPRISSVLQAAGIRTYAQLADADLTQIKDILREAGVRANPSTWPEQASLAAVGQ